MQTTQHNNTPCRIYIHPAACTSRASVEAIQRNTGRLIIITAPGRIALASQLVDTFTPFGGDAA